MENGIASLSPPHSLVVLLASLLRDAYARTTEELSPLENVHMLPAMSVHATSDERRLFSHQTALHRTGPVRSRSRVLASSYRSRSALLCSAQSELTMASGAAHSLEYMIHQLKPRPLRPRCPGVCCCEGANDRKDGRKRHTKRKSVNSDL